VLLDECQSVSRLGSETAELQRELLNSSISKGEGATRCVGKTHTPRKFSTFCPKVLAMIGEPDAVLADRCLPIPMKRKTDADVVARFILRDAKPEGEGIGKQLAAWATKHKKEVADKYTTIKPFDIRNDRMAELLLPLHAIAEVLKDDQAMTMLRAYAKRLDDRDRDAIDRSPGTLLLSVIRELFSGQPAGAMLPTTELVRILHTRTEECWLTYSSGKPITPEAVARLLKRYAIKSKRNRDKTARGYIHADFQEAFGRYLPPPSGNLANLANLAQPKGGQP
jgi:hypothetical protein